MATLRNSILTAAFVMGIAPGLASAASGKFTVSDYERALWMATRFYGAQRSGAGPNWVTMDYKWPTAFTADADGSYDLSGGWFDCGDHVTFGQTYFYSAYVLAKAYEEFPTGFGDSYHGLDYSDYEASGNWDMSGGTPDGIPDLLQELKYATDWIIKATPNSSTFYSQKGDGSEDHGNGWYTSGYQSSNMSNTQGGQQGGSRPITKNPADAPMPAFAAAALAIMSNIYRKYSPSYADSCLSHAQLAYSYAIAHAGQAAAAGSFYPANANPNAALVIAAGELYSITKSSSYQSDANTYSGNLKNHNFCFNYNNNDDMGYYVLAEYLGKSNDLSTLNSYFVSKYTSNTGEGGLSSVGSSWGYLRYSAAQAFIVALYDKIANSNSDDQFVYNQVDYILGGNNAKQSFLTGFCSGCTDSIQHPHHLNVFLQENPTTSAQPTLNIPPRNIRFGYMVGGATTSANYGPNDVAAGSGNVYAYDEGGIDYNAGLVAALGYIVSKLDPVDTSKLGLTSIHPHPGASLSFTARSEGRTLVLSSSAPLQEVLVTDLQGRTLAQALPGATSYRWTASGPGLYLTRVRTADGWASSKVLVQ
ncbi:MAG TPA: glycoside hydrolase family 9 protein [Fibrobacteria bacterium]|nr:glycoside hydrolase family 9 protein [Fibrobacteria bacterium]